MWHLSQKKRQLMFIDSIEKMVSQYPFLLESAPSIKRHGSGIDA